MESRMRIIAMAALGACAIALPLAAGGHAGSVFRTVRDEVHAIRDYDPSVTSDAQVILTYSGLHAVWLHRPAHALWRHGHQLAAQMIAQIARLLSGVEIHPGATIGRRLIIDHGTGVVIGETAVIGDDVVIYQGVTLGSVDNHGAQRHPRIGNRVFIGAGAAVLGSIHVGDGARIGAHAVVLREVPARATAVGVPARVIPVRCRNTKKATSEEVASDELLRLGLNQRPSD